MIDKIIEFFLPLLYILLFTGSLVLLTKKSFGKCLPLTMFMTAFLLFFSQLLFQTFQVGFIIAIIFALSSIILFIIQRKNRTKIFQNYFTSGFIVFLVIYVIVFIYDFARGFTVWDEFSHWGMMLKEMFRLDRFYYVDESNLMVHKDYPPIMQLLELFWMKLCGFYDEALAERAVHLFNLSLFIPFLADKISQKKNTLKSCLIGIATTIIFACVILFFDHHKVIQTIYTDYTMAILAAFLVVYILITKKIDWFDIFMISSGGAFLLLLKQMGLPLYLMILCVMIAVLVSRKYLQKSIITKNIKTILLKTVILLVPFLLWFLWHQLVQNTAQQFNISEFSVSGFIKALLGNGELWQRTAIKNFLVALGSQNISTSFIEISYIQGIIGFVGLLWPITHFIKDKQFKKETIITGIVLIFGSFGYAFAMMMLYATSFGEIEGPTLASFDRYMGTYLIIMYLALLFIAIIQYWQQSIILWATCILAVILMSPVAIKRLYPAIIDNKDQEKIYEIATNKITSNIKEQDEVFVISQENGVAFHYYLQYFMNNISINNLLYSWDENTTNTNEYFYNVVWPEMQQYEYLYIDSVNEEFENKYCEYIKICPIESHSLYRIIKDENGNLLELSQVY